MLGRVDMAVQTIKLNTGANMPAIGFGTWKIRFNGNAKKVVKQALDAGYRLIDTAKIYGNEKGVGAAIRESGIDRKEIFVTTKLWNGDQGYDNALNAFDESLKKLGLEYVDLYLIHWPVTGKRLDSWRALQDIHRGGKAHNIGVSNFTVRHLEELVSKSEMVPSVNQIEFHPFIYKDQKPILDFCKQHKIVVEAYSPLAHGNRINDPVIRQIADKYKKSAAQIMLRWALQHGTVPIPKSTDQQRIVENIDIFDFNLSDNDLEVINNLSCSMRTCWDPTSME